MRSFLAAEFAICFAPAFALGVLNIPVALHSAFQLISYANQDVIAQTCGFALFYAWAIAVIAALRSYFGASPLRGKTTLVFISGGVFGFAILGWTMASDLTEDGVALALTALVVFPVVGSIHLAYLLWARDAGHRPG